MILKITMFITCIIFIVIIYLWKMQELFMESDYKLIANLKQAKHDHKKHLIKNALKFYTYIQGFHNTNDLPISYSLSSDKQYDHKYNNTLKNILFYGVGSSAVIYDHNYHFTLNKNGMLYIRWNDYCQSYTVNFYTVVMEYINYVKNDN